MRAAASRLSAPGCLSVPDRFRFSRKAARHVALRAHACPHPYPGFGRMSLSRMDDRDAHPRPPVGKILRCRQIGGKRPKTGRSCGLFAPRGEIWRAGVGRLRKKAYFCLLLNGGTESRQTGTEPGRSCSPCGARLPGRTPRNRSGEVRFFHPLRLSDRFSR